MNSKKSRKKRKLPRIAINEIFTSIDGEVNRFGQGGLTTFIRFAGCSLNCSYCDTKYASKIKPDQYMTIHEINSKIKTRKVTITGGEPLEQRAGFDALMANLLHPFMEKNFLVTVETNGVEPIPFDKYLYAGANLGWVIDYKIEQSDRSPFKNFANAGFGDWIKIVLDVNRLEDNYSHALDVFRRLRDIKVRANFAIGLTDPMHSERVIKMLIRDGVDDVHLNIQIHKLISVK